MKTVCNFFQQKISNSGVKIKVYQSIINSLQVKINTIPTNNMVLDSGHHLKDYTCDIFNKIRASIVNNINIDHNYTQPKREFSIIIDKKPCLMAS